MRTLKDIEIEVSLVILLMIGVSVQHCLRYDIVSIEIVR
jgi:hypothetical protein